MTRDKGWWAKVGAMGVLCGLGTWSVAQAVRAPGPSAELRADETALGQFPDRVGQYTLVRRWNETLIGGALLFHWAEYAPDGGGTGGSSTHVEVGVSPVLGSHDTLVCHSARGEDPLWHGAAMVQTAGGAVSFSESLFNDGSVESLEATTLCNGESCGEYANAQTRFGFVYSKPHAAALLEQNPERPIPILLKAETADTTLAMEVARERLAADVAGFLSGVRLEELTGPYRRR